MENWLDTLIPVIQATASVFSIILAGIVWKRRQTPGTIPLTLLLLSVMLWNIATGLKSFAPNLAIFSLLSKIEILGLTSTATLYLIFIIEYTRQDYFLTRGRMLILWIVPLISLFLAFSNEAHHIFWLAADYESASTRYILKPGSMYAIHLVYYYLILTISTILLVRSILRYPQTYRLQAASLLTGAIVIWLGSLPELVPLPGLDQYWQAALHPISYTISGLVIGWGILRHRLFDLVPIAQEMVLENMIDGIIVLDANNRIVDINLPARYLFQINQQKQVIGTNLAETLAHLPSIMEKIVAEDMPYAEVYIPQPVDLTLEIMSTPVFDRHGLTRGRMLTIHDISARVRSEAAMRQSEENLRNVFENAPFPIAVASIDDGRVLYMNPAGLELYNTSIENLGKLRAQDFYRIVKQHEQVASDLKKVGGLDNIEIPMQTSDKKPIWVATSARKIVYNNEEALLITQIDISQRKKTEEELNQSRSQLRNIFEHADAGIHLLDPTGSITFSNQRWAEMLGDTAENLIGQNLSHFVYKSDIPYNRHLFESLISGEIDRYQLELRYNRRDGSVFWGVLSAIPIIKETGEIESIVNFVNDITEKKQTEKALRETERRFREILEKIYLFTVMLDTQGKITFCNDRLLSATGWRESEVIGQNWFEFFLSTEMASRSQEYTRAIQQETLVSRHENEILTRNNEILLVAWSNIILRDENGKIIGSASIGEDITERRRAQQAENEQRMFAESLYDTAAAITSTLHFEEVLDRILENIDAAVETDCANISLIERGKVHFVRAKGYEKHGVSNQDILNFKFSLNRVKNLKVIYQSKKPFCIPDTRNYAGWKKIPTSQWIRSYVGVPIIIKDKVVGFINIDSATPGFFNDKHAERLMAFSLQAAIAIENTRLYTKSLHELEERKRAQARLRRANQKLKTQLVEIETLQTQLREQAIRDALTGLFNRRYLEEILPEEIEYCRRVNLPLSLVMIDIDHFKVVNDTYGHQVGDLVLQDLGKLLQADRLFKTFPCRYGGEEFVIILPGLGREKAREYAESLRLAFSEYRLAEKAAIQVTISIGVASLDSENQDGQALLTSADNALYQAKQAGRNCVKTAGQ